MKTTSCGDSDTTTGGDEGQSKRPIKAIMQPVENQGHNIPPPQDHHVHEGTICSVSRSIGTMPQYRESKLQGTSLAKKTSPGFTVTQP
jgi:hypothetical protein